MRVAVIRFPGSNCDQDALKALGDAGAEAEYVWHTESSLDGFDGAFVPGGFSYGDYLRCGAIASRSSAMAEVARLAARGAPVLGACNGFQILCEAGLLPGALLRNAEERFVCRWTGLSPVGTSRWTEAVAGAEISLPVAHGEGRYVIEGDDLHRLQDRGGVAFRYSGHLNGSTDDIAGVTNEGGNVLGLMPHPERACLAELGGTDGLKILRGFFTG